MSAFLSDIELYFTVSGITPDREILLSGDELKHAVKVMRHIKGDTLYATDGCGSLFKTVLRNIHKEFCTAKIIEQQSFENNFSNIHFCIPVLKNPDRFEFALEKCTELGITNFIVYHANRSAPKGFKVERWERILLSAMKQSLRTFLPKITTVDALSQISSFDGVHFLFDKKVKKYFNNEINFVQGEKYYFIFGPEGGLDEKEISLFKPENIYMLSTNRLRSETAIINVAVTLSNILLK